jgi:GNAT superfamily N-acetyltransferase/predicted ABC-type transport system involved in lysophospholipase L1 biosynthesis ATPase subunit
MKIAIRHHCSDFDSYRAARVKSLFNVESGADFCLDCELPIDDGGWKIGVVAGPSGSGKSSIGAALGAIYAPRWPKDKPIIDAIAPGGDFNAATGALAAVGLGSVPAWLRPYPVLSNGERFRALLARLICDAPGFAVVDEFSSVVDRQIARIGAGAFAKAWRRAGGQVVLLSCHYDILDWLRPDWVFDTAGGQFERGRLRCRPRLEMSIYQTDGRDWPAFEPHHYLKLPRMIAATHYVAAIRGEPVAHVAVSTRPGMIEARAARLVVLPEWQGLGIGTRFLDAVCGAWRRGENRYGRPMRTLLNTSHPGLAAALRRSPKWTQVSACLCGGNKARSHSSIHKSQLRRGKASNSAPGYGGHFRAVQGFRYLGPDDAPDTGPIAAQAACAAPEGAAP